jgi:hypothetical protein
VIGFFVSRLCRKLALVNRRGAKKPNEHAVFVWKALGKVPFWEDVLNEVKNGSPVTSNKGKPSLLKQFILLFQLGLNLSKHCLMPKIAIYKFLTFFIYAFDAINEPPHLHIAKEKGNRQRSAKIWLETLKVAEKGSLTETDLKQAIKVIKENQPILIESFNNIKAGKKITTIKIK